MRAAAAGAVTKRGRAMNCQARYGPTAVESMRPVSMARSAAS